jgi:hypothetical protein
MDWDDGLKYARFAPRLTGEMQASVVQSASVEIGTYRKRIARLLGKPFTIRAGLVPLVFKPNWDIYVTASGSTKAGITFHWDLTASVEAGVEFTEAGGWQTIREATSTGTVIDIEVAPITSELRFAPTRSEFSLYLYGVAGPYLNLDLPEYKFILERSLVPRFTRAAFDETFQGQAGFKVRVLSKTLAEFGPVDLPPYNVLIWERVFRDDAQAEVEID